MLGCDDLPEAEEELDIPVSLIRKSFYDGIRSHGLSFLNKLELVLLNDPKLDATFIKRSLTAMRAHYNDNYLRGRAKSDSVWDLSKWFSESWVERINKESYLLSTNSPTREDNNILLPRDTFERTTSVQSEYYDDDFESVDDSEIQNEFGFASPANLQANNFFSPRGNPIPLQSLNVAAPFARRQDASLSRGSRSELSRPYSWISQREWKLGEKIGSGSFGEVFQGMNSRGKLFAVKRMHFLDKQSEVSNFMGEIKLMSGLQHQNIVQYFGTWVDEAECILYIFQEWVPGGSVAHLLKKFGSFSLTTVKSYTRQALCGLQYLHEHHIIHRDIKGGNILVDDSGVVKLADFGASTTLNDFNKTQETANIKGTPYFMAPEVLSSAKYGRKGDIWAMGCTMIEMLTGEPPWKDRGLRSIIQLHILLSSWNEGPPPCSCFLTPEAKECLHMCFRKNPNDRPSAAELLDCSFLQESIESEECQSESFYADDTERIRNAIDSAVSKSRSSAILSVNEDMIEAIDRQLHKKDREQESTSKSQADQRNPFKKQSTPAINRYSYSDNKFSHQEEKQWPGSTFETRGRQSDNELAYDPPSADLKSQPRPRRQQNTTNVPPLSSLASITDSKQSFMTSSSTSARTVSGSLFSGQEVGKTRPYTTGAQHFDTVRWMCMNCNKSNSHPDYCEFCATMRGSNGKRDSKAKLVKRN